MNAKEKAVVITEIAILRSKALGLVLFHENEAARYRKHLRDLGIIIERIGSEPVVGKSKGKKS